MEVVEERRRPVHLEQHRGLQRLQPADLTLHRHIRPITPETRQTTKIVQTSNLHRAIDQRTIEQRTIEQRTIDH